MSAFDRLYVSGSCDACHRYMGREVATPKEAADFLKFGHFCSPGSEDDE